MVEKSMCTSNDDKQDYLVCRLNLTVEKCWHCLIEPNNQDIFLNTHIFLEVINKTLGSSIIGSPMSPTFTYLMLDLNQSKLALPRFYGFLTNKIVCCLYLTTIINLSNNNYKIRICVCSKRYPKRIDPYGCTFKGCFKYETRLFLKTVKVSDYDVRKN